MLYIKILIRSLFILLLSLSHFAFALTIGSDTVPSRQAFVVFPSGVGNIILGYAAMDGGFSLTDNLTTLSFNSYFAVNSSMSLSDGAVYLLNDLTFASFCDVATTGTIYGNGYTVSWMPRLNSAPVPSIADLPGSLCFDNANVIFNSPIELQSPLYFSGTCILDGHNYTINLGTGSIHVVEGSSLLLKNVIIKGVEGTNISCLDSQGVISLGNVTCQLSADYTFVEGKLNVIGDTLMTGTCRFVYRTGQSSTIYADATWFFDSGMTFSYDPVNGISNLLNFENSEANLHFYETSLYAPSTGLQLTKGALTVQGNCPVLSAATSEANGIIIGDGISALNDVSLYILPESGLNVISGYLINKNVS